MFVLTFCGGKWKGRFCVRMQFPQKFCPLCDKQVIASALRQLRINFTCIFRVFPDLPLLLCSSGNFRKTLKDAWNLSLIGLRPMRLHYMKSSTKTYSDTVSSKQRFIQCTVLSNKKILAKVTTIIILLMTIIIIDNYNDNNNNR